VDGSLALSGRLGLAVREVYADGRVRTTPAELRAQLGIEIGQPILAVDPDATRARLEQLPWVEQASVERQLPDRIEVRLIERRPLALWQTDGRFALIDRGGDVIMPDIGQESVDMEPAGADAEIRYGQLRVLVGEQAPRHAAQLFALLSTEPALWSRVAAATWVGDRRWTLRLDNRIDVLLPEQGVQRAWRFLAAKARDEALLDRAISVIDLRFLPDRLRLRLDPVALQDSKA
jgi:cell division protein FtsQ